MADLLADAHYATVAKVAHENGLKVYGEALEDGRPVLGDDLAMRHNADVPMAALWTWNRDAKPRPTLLGDMKGAASVAHIYGQNIVAAESMTSVSSPWAFAPSDLKRIIDLEFASGINRPVVHTSVHQPVDDKVPGLSLMIFGQYFNRHESWAEMAKPWVDYMSRTSFMLQQGHDHADIAWFYGEHAPITALFVNGEPAGLPKGYGYDFVNADILTIVLKVEDGQLVAPGGARYCALYLGGSSRVMTLPTLRRGAPPSLSMQQLSPLNEAKQEGARYFSGVTIYSSRFTLPKEAKRGQLLWLDLGKVGDLAEVRVNGKLAGTSWFAPYRLDIGRFVKPGSNRLEVKVANLWVNRLIGDKQPGAKPITFTAAPTYRPDAPLRPSGLIGPVTLWTD